jgi:hypothetical protein
MSDPAPKAEWQVWYQDTFDRECPRQVEVAGLGLVKGLTELWARHLFENVPVQAGGFRGFSRFNLWWQQERKSVEIVGDWDGAVRLRGWVYGEKLRTHPRYREKADKRLLKAVAVAHGHLLLAGQSSEPLLAAAKDSEDRRDFERRLSELVER